MVTVSQTLKIYELLNKHFKNEEDAKALVQEIESVIDVKFDSAKDRLATKTDLVKEISKVETAIAESKVDIIKWLVGMSITIVGLVVAFIKLL